MEAQSGSGRDGLSLVLILLSYFKDYCSCPQLFQQRDREKERKVFRRICFSFFFSSTGSGAYPRHPPDRGARGEKSLMLVRCVHRSKPLIGTLLGRSLLRVSSRRADIRYLPLILLGNRRLLGLYRLTCLQDRLGLERQREGEKRDKEIAKSLKINYLFCFF
jgi:hypothetical protein